VVRTGPAFRFRPEPATHQRAALARRGALRRTELVAGPASYLTYPLTAARDETDSSLCVTDGRSSSPRPARRSGGREAALALRASRRTWTFSATSTHERGSRRSRFSPSLRARSDTRGGGN